MFTEKARHCRVIQQKRKLDVTHLAKKGKIPT